MIKTNIKMRVTPEQSAKVQEICFKNGIDWGLDNTVMCEDKPYIFIEKEKELNWLSERQNDNFMRAKEEEIDPELFIRTNGSCIEKEEFTYPMWFKSKKCCLVVRFDGLKSGKICIGDNMYRSSGTYRKCWNPHTNTEIWEQVENPNLATDKEIEQVINEEYEMDTSINNGGKTDCYQLKNAPFPINDFDDFAEWRGLNGSQFNMGKVMWTFNTGRHSGTNYERDLNKIIHYANRELLRLKRDGK